MNLNGNAFFIVGTDTGVGKTHVTCHVAKQTREKDEQVRILKPVATGCLRSDKGLVSEDALMYQAAKIESIVGWTFEPPVSPHIAAALEGTHLSAETIVDWCETHRLSSPGLTLIEGAGGLMVPLNSTETWVEVLCLLNMPVILVVGIRLGCLNHALLTWHVLKSKGIAVAGWVANHVDKHCLYPDQVVGTLVDKIEAPCLFRLPYQEGTAPLADARGSGAPCQD